MAERPPSGSPAPLAANQRGRVLIVEDDAALREVLSFNLADAGLAVDAVGSAEEALAWPDPGAHDVVLTDLRLRGLDGIGLLARLRERDPAAVVLVMTAYGALDVAVNAMQAGAFHYVEKPVNTLTLVAILERAVEFSRLGRAQRAEGPARGDLVISTSPAMNEVMRLVDKVADSDAPILVRGESGTGKELVARAIHARSGRRGAFVPVNCSAIPPELLESVLFGHERGAFTGAVRAAPGKFVSADGGTLFLDEIGEMSPDLQAKLLRVLQDGQVEAVGAREPRHVDVRVVSATHRDLRAMIAEGSFREDLFYRLDVIPIRVPPLRERRDDVPVIFRHFLRRHAPRRAWRVEREVDEALAAYAWPGDLPERVFLGAAAGAGPGGAGVGGVAEGGGPDGDPDADGLPFTLPDGGLDLRDLERRIIQAALRRHGGNQSATARYLGLPRHKLLYRLEKFGIKEDP